MNKLSGSFDQSNWLPTSKKEMEKKGWERADVIFFTGDAYIDHPAFGTAILARLLESQGFRVAVVPQPNWRDDLRDFKKMGKPRLFFGVSAGAMDSMVNHYTAKKRIRSNDSYSPGGHAGFRPDYATLVYTNILKRLFPGTPVIIGGIEASMRRFAHYDYWQDKIKPSILAESGADLLVYGMGEKPLTQIARLLDKNVPVKNLVNIPQTVFPAGKYEDIPETGGETVEINSYHRCIESGESYAANFKAVEKESSSLEARRIIQKNGDIFVVANPPCPPPKEKEIDAYYNLPFNRIPHPRYTKKDIIPAFEMIRDSITIHRGCFGGCSFCAISAHQGKFVSSRSFDSILKEAENITRSRGFKGYISDIGGPTANMYRMGGRDPQICQKCKKPSCIFPVICRNLNTCHQPLVELYRKVRDLPGVKKVFVTSGVRYDLFLITGGDKSHGRYARELIRHHVSGRLKVAPEHTAPHLLHLMRKPSFGLFKKLKRLFDQVNKKEGLNQQLVPYFISGHPGCSSVDMAHLALDAKKMNIRPQQVQDFTPTPMTLSTVMYHTGIDSFTENKIYVPRTKNEKTVQNKFFFWYKKEYRNQIRSELLKNGKKDLAVRLLDK